MQDFLKKIENITKKDDLFSLIYLISWAVIIGLLLSFLFPLLSFIPDIPNISDNKTELSMKKYPVLFFLYISFLSPVVENLFFIIIPSFFRKKLKIALIISFVVFILLHPKLSDFYKQNGKYH